MNVQLIGPDNQKFEAQLVRYFQNVNDKYLVYTKNEKDSNGFVLLHVTKVISDNGIKIGENITDENEWSLIKNFLKQTVNENKENRPLTINDINPVEVNDLKINACRPFKLQEAVVELFGKNKKSFEIVQQMIDRQNTAVPVPPEITEFVTESKDSIVEPKTVTVDNKSTIDETNSTNAIEDNSSEAASQITTENTPTAPIIEKSELKTDVNYEEMYNKELERNNELSKEMEELIKNNADLKSKLGKIAELLS